MKKDNVIYRFPDLFRGLFFGDRPRLIKIQKNFLDKIDENKWDKVREEYGKKEVGNFEKLAERFGIAGEKLEKLKQMTILSRVPPPHQETLKIVQKNEKMLSKAKNSL